MSFLAQIAIGEIRQDSEGIYHSFVCTDFRVGAVGYQQS